MLLNALIYLLNRISVEMYWIILFNNYDEEELR